MSLCFDDLADAPRPHCILGRQGELVPGAALEILQAVRTLAGADGKTAPLLAVVLRVLQDVSCEEEETINRSSSIQNWTGV